jgi:hypothetical protein
MPNVCKIKNDSIVKWTILKENIENQLIGNLVKGKYTGLLYSDTESAGDIDFIDHSCKPDKTCNKQTITDLKYENGNSDSVITPNAVINFHTHPLSCYIEAKTIWGWPSGEDLARSIEFALSGNLCHIVFAVEGTYIIDVNKYFIEFFKGKSGILKNVINNIEKVFQLTHKHRMYQNDSNPEISLKSEFFEFFLKELDLQKKEYILFDWLELVNNLNMFNLDKISKKAQQKIQSKEFIIKDLKLSEIPIKIKKMNIFNISFIPNETAQWKKIILNSKGKTKYGKILKYGDLKTSDELLYQNLCENKYKLEIILPDLIEYNAPFISAECKL